MVAIIYTEHIVQILSNLYVKLCNMYKNKIKNLYKKKGGIFIMKTMKKLIAISLAVVMVVAVLATMSVPAAAHRWHDSTREANATSTTKLIAPDAAEITMNAGKLPSGTEITLGSNDTDWKYAYPYTVGKAFYANSEISSKNIDADLYFAYDSGKIYIKQVHFDTVVTGEVKYRFIASGIDMVEGTKKHVGAEIIISSANPTDGTIGAVSATTLEYAWSPDNVGAVGNYKVQNTISGDNAASSVAYKDNGTFVIETSIPWGALGLTSPQEGTLLGFKAVVNGVYNVINRLESDGKGHVSGGKVYHDEWDWFSPMYLREVNENASTQSLRAAIDTTWYNENESEFVLTTANQLRGLAYIVNTKANLDGAKAVTAGKIFKLGADIDLNPDWNATSDLPPIHYWIPIEVFCGTFDGQGYEIRDMVCTPVMNGKILSGIGFASNPERDMAFVSHTYGETTIKDLILTDAEILTKYSGASIVGKCMEGTLKISNIYVDADVTTDAVDIIDWATKKVKLTNQIHKWSYSGGIIARSMVGTDGAVVVENVVLKGNLKAVMSSTSDDITIAPVAGATSKSISINNVYVDLDSMTATASGSDVTSSQTAKLSKGTFTGSNNMEYGSTAAYPAGWVNIDESNTIKMPASVAAMVDSNLWVQERINETNMDIRVLTVLDAKDDWTAFGVKVEMEINGAFVEIPGGEAFKSSKVYNSINAAGVKKSAAELGGKYVGGIVLTNSPKTVKLRITPVKYVGEQAYYGGSSVIEYVDGVFQ